MVSPVFLILSEEGRTPQTYSLYFFACTIYLKQLTFPKWHLLTMTPCAPWFIHVSEREKPTSQIKAKAKAHGSSVSDEDRLVCRNLTPTTSGKEGTSTQAHEQFVSPPEPKERLLMRKIMHFAQLWPAFALKREHWETLSWKELKNCFDSYPVFPYFYFSFLVLPWKHPRHTIF